MEIQHIVGIVCEFNPFHNGHKYLIDEVKRKTNSPVVCVMSGNFVQRGDLAIVDKFTRAEMALKNGADMIIELPVRFSLSSAESFAAYAVYLLNAIGCDTIAFGAETEDNESLIKLADYLLSDDFKIRLSEEETKNCSFPSLREKIVQERLGEYFAELLKTPNNILAIEYIKGGRLINTNLSFLPIKRAAAEHDSISELSDENNIISATQLRNLIIDERNFSKFVPSSAAEIIQKELSDKRCPAVINNLERAIIAFLRTADTDYLRKVPDVSEGLENRLIEAAKCSLSLAELYSRVKSKRYTLSRIRRIVLCAYLGIYSETNENEKNLLRYVVDNNNYLRILGFNENGKSLLSAKTNALPIVSSFADVRKLDEKAQAQYDFEGKCDSIYAAAMPEIFDGREYYTHKLIIV